MFKMYDVLKHFMKQQERNKKESRKKERKKPDLVLHKSLNEPYSADTHAQARTDVTALSIRCIRLVQWPRSVTVGEKKQILVRPAQD